MPIFELRKFSKLLNPSLVDSAWFHYPERSELSLTFEKLTPLTVKVKVIWRYKIFEQVVFTPDRTSPSIKTLSVNYKRPYISFKVADSAEQEAQPLRFQVSFYKSEEFENCLKYLEEIGVSIKEINGPLISSSRYSIIGDSQLQANPLQSQLSQNEIGTQVDLRPPTQTFHPWDSQLSISRQATEHPRQNSLISSKNTSLVESDLSLLGDLTFSNDTSAECHLSNADLQDISDDALKRIVLKTLEDPKFLSLCMRVDRIVSMSEPQ